MSRPHENPLTPYVVGAGIGALNIVAFLSAKRGIGVSSAFETLAAKTGRAVAPDMTGINAYVKERGEAPKIDWESLLVLGIPVGSYLAARLGGAKEMPDISPEWENNFGSSQANRNLGAFLGGAAVMMGARLAKGCTSGHGITGTSQLALSSLIFTPLMFATAALASRVLYRKERSS